jgi:uncharacterized damage-inducible protein DinB
MLPRLLDHLVWADQRVADSLATLPAPDPELLRLYSHVLGAEATWLGRLTGQATDVPVWPDLDLAACRALATRNHAQLKALPLDAASLARPVTYTNSRGATFTDTMEEILHHVCLHGMHHRGQVVRGVRLGGGTPLATDFIVFVRGG